MIKALESDFPDFEDATQNFLAEKNNADVIITRNKKDFVKSSVRIYTPAEMIDYFQKNIR